MGRPPAVGGDRLIAEATVREALSDGIRIAMLLAATISLAGAGYAAFTICRDEGRPSADARHSPLRYDGIRPRAVAAGTRPIQQVT
jgi:hypothetical protein